MPAPFVRINLKVIPQAKTNKVEDASKDEKGALHLKVRVTAPPEDGKANEAVIKLLSSHFDISKSSVEIASGWTTRQKVVIIHSISEADVLKTKQLPLI